MSRKLTVHGPLQASGQIFPEKKVPIYNINIEQDYSALKDALKHLSLEKRKVLIITDETIAPFWLEEVKDIAASCAAVVYSFIISPGEVNKNLNTIESIYEKLITLHFDRNDVLFALGGGVIGDMTGYAAATYLRGIRFVQLPTSLLAMVDSSIGGKTGVDFKSYKNMVGAFKQPEAVYINLSVLHTLLDREFYSGFGEIIKHGLIKNKDYLQFLSSHKEAVLKRNSEALEEVVYQSCLIKRAVVEEDPTEKGERALLNFGHTLGHSIERFMDFKLLHGECVSLGIAAASYLSFSRNQITRAELTDLLSLLTSYHMPVTLPSSANASENISDTAVNKMVEITHLDKKMESGQIKFILLNAVGDAYIDQSVTDDEMKRALSFLTGGITI